MATNNAKCLALISATAVFITIIQANATFKANTVTNVHNRLSNKSETTLQYKTRLEYSDIKQFKESKNTKEFTKHDFFKNITGSDHPKVKFKHSKYHTKKIRRTDFNKYQKLNLNASKHVQKNISPIKENYAISKVSFRHKRAIRNSLLAKKRGRLLKNKHDVRKRRPHLRKANEEHPNIVQTNPKGCQAALKEDVEKFEKKSRSLTDTFKKAIEAFVKEVGGNKFDKEMYDVMLANRSVSERALHSAGGVVGAVPAGLQLGGYGILKQANTLLFFHRMKLRNKTDFLLGPIKSNWHKMTLETYLVLGDLHLTGNFERLKIDKIPSNLYYAPTYGSANILLRDVHYKLEGRYRLSGGRLIIEQIISNITSNEPGIIVYDNAPELYVRAPSPMIEFEQLADFVDRMKIDLNEWVKDYFNDYLTYFGLASERVNAEFQRYDKRKGLEFDGYIDHVLKILRRRIEQLPANETDSSEFFNLPEFTILTIHGMTLKLRNGRVEGLNTIYRRGPGTGWRETWYMLLDAVVAFSDLKVVYKYEATTPAEGTPMQGHLILTANELAAHMSVQIIGKYYIKFDEIYPLKVQTLTIEGPVNRMIGSFRHVLENQITALLTNVLMKKVKDLETGSDVLCKVFNDDARLLPRLQGFDDDENDHNLVSPIEDFHSKPTTPVGEVPDDHDRPTENPDKGADTPNVNSVPDPGWPDEVSHGEATKPIEGVSNDHENPAIRPDDDPVTPERNPHDNIHDPHDEITEQSPPEDSKAPDGDATERPDDGIQSDQTPVPVTDNEPGDDVHSNNEVLGITEQHGKPDLVMEKSDSIELELPKDAEHNKARQVHVERKEQFKLYERKDQADGLRKFVGRQNIAKKGGKNSKSQLLVFG